MWSKQFQGVGPPEIHFFRYRWRETVLRPIRPRSPKRSLTAAGYPLNTNKRHAVNFSNKLKKHCFIQQVQLRPPPFPFHEFRPGLSLSRIHLPRADSDRRTHESVKQENHLRSHLPPLRPLPVRAWIPQEAAKGKILSWHWTSENLLLGEHPPLLLFVVSNSGDWNSWKKIDRWHGVSPRCKYARLPKQKAAA